MFVSTPKEKPNLLCVELLPAQIKACIICLKFLAEMGYAPKPITNWVINPTIRKMEEVLNENK